jgi:hypothetical protein
MSMRSSRSKHTGAVRRHGVSGELCSESEKVLWKWGPAAGVYFGGGAERAKTDFATPFA